MFVKNVLAPFAFIFVVPALVFPMLVWTTERAVLKDLVPTRGAWLLALVFGVYSFLSMMVGPKWLGPRNVDNVVPEYVNNGFSFWLWSVSLFLVLSVLFPWVSAVIHKEFLPFLVVMNLIGLTVCALLFASGRNKYFDRNEAQELKLSNLFLFYRGVEHHPRVFGVDVKQWTNCRFGLMVWQLLVIAFGFHSFHLHGLNWGVMVNVLLQTVYLGKFYFWETGYFNTIDITLDRAGYYICWGCLVFVPAFYTFSTYHMCNFPPQISGLHAALVLLFGLASIALNYWSDWQKELFKQGLWPTAKHIRTEKGSLLLVDGTWAYARHLNYTFELMLAGAWCCVGYPHYLPNAYFVYLTVLLVHRVFRDEEKCSKKYGKLWVEYTQRVPWRMLPGVW